MDIGQFYDIVNFIADKHQQGYLSPNEFNNSLNLAQRGLMNELVEALQGWDGNKKRIRLIMGNAQPVTQKLAPFIVGPTNVVVPGTGSLAKPSGMEHMLALRNADNMKPIKRVESDRVSSNLSSRIDTPTKYPFYTEYATVYKIYPADIGSINWEYVATVPDAKYAYTLSGGRPVYDPGNSIQLLWGEGEIAELMSRVLFMFGISIQAQNLVQYYQAIKTDGQ